MSGGRHPRFIDRSAAWPSALLVLLLVGCASMAKTKEARMDRPMPGSLTECAHAVAGAETALSAAGHDPARYALVRAVLGPSPRADAGGAIRWNLTFKERSALTLSPDAPVTAGGEVFVEVNPLDGAARITGLGE